MTCLRASISRIIASKPTVAATGDADKGWAALGAAESAESDASARSSPAISLTGVSRASLSRPGYAHHSRSVGTQDLQDLVRTKPGAIEHLGAAQDFPGIGVETAPGATPA